MRSLTRFIAVAVVGVMPLVAVTATPAGAKSVPAKEWMTEFCTVYGDWVTTIQSASEDVQSLAGDGTLTDLSGGRNALVDLLSQSVDATETAVSNLEAAGIPDAPNGKKIDATIITALKKAQKVFEDAVMQAEGLSTTDPAAFASGADQITDDLGVGLDRAFAGFAKIDKLDSSKTFRKLSKKLKACKALEG
jgi:hypothetical protein